MRKVRILVIEDDKIDQMAFRRFVEANDIPYDYTIASSVSEAKTILDSREFDVVIADYLLGDGTAFDIFDLKMYAPIIVVTGSGDEEIAVKAMKAGAYDYMIKDPEHNYLKVLPATVESALRLRRAEEDRERLLKELEAKNTELERFSYTVSHDLRAPLLTIQGFATVVREDLKENKRENVESNLKSIAEEAEKMEHLLDGTLQLSRIGRVANPPEDASFADIAKDALEQVSEQLRTKAVNVSVADGFPTVHVDRMRIAEVLVNLITNSIRYMGEQSQPKIDIGYRMDGEETVFFVRDNGIGIDKSQHEKVFELFYRLDRHGKGTGAGLAIVKRIIEVHKGCIWIESEPNKGCTVCFTLPLTSDN